jgi:hypothetical protein
MESRAVNVRACVGLCVAAAACTAVTPSPSAVTTPVAVTAPVSADSIANANVVLIPAGYGTLRQDDIAITINPGGTNTSANVVVTAIPLDESVIRVLAPDSYRTLHAVLEGSRRTIEQRARFHNVRNPRVWYVRFYGVTPQAQFVPTDFTVTSGGRDYRPFDVIPLTPGFGTQQVQPRTQQTGLLLFEEGVDVTQPIVVAMGNDRNTDWNVGAGGILTKIETERANIRARAPVRP